MTPENASKTDALLPGVYAAIATLNGKTYASALSIGWNPVYNNKERTIEAFLVHDFEGSLFYGENLKVELKQYIRGEALFDDFDHLILAIQCDILTVI
jgi:riboflavin kinase / FMN hydrolase